MGRGRVKIKNTFLTILLLLAIGSAQVFGANLIKFTDITASRYDWVRPYIEKMNLAGVVQGMTNTTYEPDRAVTREQLITMLVRLMGWESQASGKSLPSDFPKASSVAPWARGYVAIAIEKGIVVGKDFQDFRPQDAAKRAEVAVFAVRALGLGQEAENRKYLSVSLGFTDVHAIELDARPYVEIAVEKGIMKGFPDNSFKPDEKFTRAQMAVVLHNLSKLTKVQNIISGVVHDIETDDLPYIEVKLDDGTLGTYMVNLDTTVIYKEDENGNLIKAELKDIKVGDYVNLIASGNSALYIDFNSGSQAPVTGGNTVDGTIKEINLTKSTVTVITNDNKERTYNIKSQTKVYIDGTAATLYQLSAGQPVILTVSGTDVEQINVKGQDKEVKGIIRAINTSTYVLTIENEANDKYESYNIASNVKVYKDNKATNIYNLSIGDVATITVTGSRIVEIVAESATREVTGTVTGIEYAKNPVLVVEDDGGKESKYELNKDVSINKNGKKAGINDLKIGDEATLTLEYDSVVKVVAESVKRKISGTVKAITFADVTTVTVVDDNGKEYLVKITPNTKITRDKKQIDVTEIRRDYFLAMEVENDEAISVEVTVKNTHDVLRGTVIGIHENIEVLVVSVKADGGTKEISVRYTSNTVVLKSSKDGTKSHKISKIEEGNEIVAIGSYEGGLFVAVTIQDITFSN